MRRIGQKRYWTRIGVVHSRAAHGEIGGRITFIHVLDSVI